jgi:hypothetical protein
MLSHPLNCNTSTNIAGVKHEPDISPSLDTGNFIHVLLFFSSTNKIVSIYMFVVILHDVSHYQNMLSFVA